MGPASITTLHNSDGEEVVFHRVMFPFARGVTPELVGERLVTKHWPKRESTHFRKGMGEETNGHAQNNGRMVRGGNVRERSEIRKSGDVRVVSEGWREGVK